MYRYLVDTTAGAQKCTGPFQLREWMQGRYIRPDTLCYDVRDKKTRTAKEILEELDKRPSFDTVEDIEQTLTDLEGVAAKLEEMLANETRRKQRCATRSIDVISGDASWLDANDSS